MNTFFWHRASVRTFIAILAINLPLIALSHAVLTGLVDKNMKAAYENTVRSKARLVAASVEGKSDPAEIRDILDDLTLSGEVVHAALIIADGEGSMESSVDAPGGYLFQENFGFGEHNNGVYGISIPVMVSTSRRPAHLRLGYDESPVTEQMSQLRQWGLYAASMSIAILIPISLLVAVFLTSPLRRLRYAAHSVSNGNLETPLFLSSGIDEVNALSSDLDHMRVQLIRRGDEIAGREARYRAVLDNAAEGILTLNRQGDIESINEAAQIIFGYRADEVLGTSFTRFLVAADIDRCIDPDSGPNTGTGLSFTATRKNGGTLPILLSVSAFRLGDADLYSTVVQDISERMMFEKKLEHLAYYDSLTGLPNRRLFQDRLSQALIQAERHEKLVAVLFLDLDRFKIINDTRGHMIGDLLLQAVAKRIREAVRSEDTVARLGGDEFSIILMSISNIQNATLVAEKVISLFARPFQLGGHEIFTSTSIGITLYPFDDNNTENLIKNADTAMYHAKSRGGNTVELYAANMRIGTTERLGMENALRKAMQEASLQLHYQPQVILHYQPQIDRFSGQIIGTEALVRWQHPELGLVLPQHFIPLAEETGLIIPIGEWVLRTACEQNRAWQDAGLPNMCVAVNISVRQLQHPGIVEQIAEILEETGLEPAYLELELTESMVLHNRKEICRTLRELRDMGIKLSIDDFGTGQSSLSNIQQLPVDTIKIDRSFVRNITNSESDAAIAIAIIVMAHELGLQVVAEGVETEEQLMFLHSHQCDVMQGYFFSRPVPAEDLEALLVSGIMAQNPLGWDDVRREHGT